ncbi:DIS3-like exonuclease 2 isoform X2 [Condylostylus longicornis]|uniref:DIS3-like exonuclease 2 isoform X2 n=1 Tax=Condylostylus longicornis TaxID=2530218 RepID=UPI00244E3AFA|nr:DIS3-like exonuclease 2 isoform X2 [Condylostylus longicornis]
MEKESLSSDANKETQIKILQEQLKASGNRLQASLTEYRKKIEASKNDNNGPSKSKSESPAPSLSSESLSINSKNGFCANKEKKPISKVKIDSDFSLSNSSLNSHSTNEHNTPSAMAKKREILERTEIKEKIGQIKNKIIRFNRKNSEAPRYPSVNAGRNRSISERSYTSQSTSVGNRQRSLSGTYSTADSEFSNISQNTKESILTNGKKMGSDISEDTAKIRKRGSRGKRGSKSKSKETQANAEHIPYYAKECDSLYINAETLLILDLLFLPLEQHHEYLLNLAKIRKILVPSPEGYVYNPRLKRMNSILELGNQCRNLNSENLKKIRKLMSNDQENGFDKSKEKKVRLDSESKRIGEKKSKVFEDYVNEIVGDYLSEDKKEEFLFPKRPKSQRTKNYFNSKNFETELEKYAQKLVEANLGVIVESDIRINGKNNEQAFVKNVSGKKDAFIGSLVGRKYALHGDIVKIFVRNDDSEKQATKYLNEVKLRENIEALQDEKTTQNNTCNEAEGNQPGPSSVNADNINTDNVTTCDDNDNTELCDELEQLNNSNDLLIEPENDILPEKSSKAFVIKIVEKVHNRKCVGNFLSYRKSCEFITFVPRDLKMPNIRIYKADWPEPFQKGELQSISDVLYVAQITDWLNGICIGKILHPIGKCGELESENKAILLQNGLEMDPYDEKFNKMFDEPLLITEDDIKIREDLRSECIFTIDPLTARDLDDAMSCKTMPNGNYEIGVHISDVTHFLKEKTELDEIVSLRSTSVYMVNEVFHMLPKPLCFKCSLLPGEDKFAFSCFWEVTPSGEIKNTRMSRTIINSCTQFAYEHAQKIIDFPNKIFETDDFPQIHNGWSVEDIVKRIKILHLIAEIWRKNRFQDGALKINRPKLYFRLDGESGEPVEFFQATLQTANYLIEEYMLMANRSVADFIYKKYPKIAFLRNHDPPLPNVIQKVQTKLKQLGFNLDISSSKLIYSSLTDIVEKSDNPPTLEACLNHLISNSMTRARYFCSENAKTPEEFWHYALSIPIYTHFTSPIRRYPDILVHRVLAAALDYDKPPCRSTDELHVLAAICNEKKYTAKLAGEDSSNLYFMYYIKSNKSIIMKAAVLETFMRSMEVILLMSGHQIRVTYPNDKSPVKVAYNTSSKTAFLIKESEEPVELKKFSEIEIEVYIEKFKIKGRIPGTAKNVTNELKNGLIKENNAENCIDKVDELETGSSDKNDEILLPDDNEEKNKESESESDNSLSDKNDLSDNVPTNYTCDAEDSLNLKTVVPVDSENKLAITSDNAENCPLELSKAQTDKVDN